MSFSRRIYIKAMMWVVFTLAILGAVVIVSFSSLVSHPARYGMIATLLIGYGMYPLIEKIVDWLDKKLGPILDKKKQAMDSAKRGFQGEDTVGAWLHAILPSKSILCQPEFSYASGNPFDIDFVVVHDRGVIVIEVKNVTDEIIFEGEKYYSVKEGKKNLLPPENDPRSEVERHVWFLEHRLRTAGVYDGPIVGVLVFPNGQVSWVGKPGVYIVKDAHSLEQFLKELPINSLCTPAVQMAIKQALQS